MDSYTLKKHKVTNELHIFIGRFNPPGTDRGCVSSRISICEKMQGVDSQGNVFACLTEGQARTQCAELGRKVCGICVSNLYATY